MSSEPLQGDARPDEAAWDKAAVIRGQYTYFPMKDFLRRESRRMDISKLSPYCPRIVSREAAAHGRYPGIFTPP